MRRLLALPLLPLVAVEVMRELAATLQSLDRRLVELSAPGGPIDRLAGLPATLDRLAELSATLDRLAELERTLAELGALGVTLERLGTLQPTLEALSSSVETLSAVVGPLGRLADRVPGARPRVAPPA
jgi:hypothetical protein